VTRSKMTQREAAELLDIHEVYLSQILKGIRQPGLTTATRIEDVTGIGVRSWQLTDLSESPEPVAATARARRSSK